MKNNFHQNLKLWGLAAIMSCCMLSPFKVSAQTVETVTLDLSQGDINITDFTKDYLIMNTSGSSTSNSISIHNETGLDAEVDVTLKDLTVSNNSWRSAIVVGNDEGISNFNVNLFFEGENNISGHNWSGLTLLSPNTNVVISTKTQTHTILSASYSGTLNSIDVRDESSSVSFGNVSGTGSVNNSAAASLPEALSLALTAKPFEFSLQPNAEQPPAEETPDVDVPETDIPDNVIKGTYNNAVLSSWDDVRTALKDFTAKASTVNSNMNPVKNALMEIDVQQTNGYIDASIVKILENKNNVGLHLLLGNGISVTFLGQNVNENFKGTYLGAQKKLLKDGAVKDYSLSFNENGAIGSSLIFHINLENSAEKKVTVSKNAADGSRIEVLTTTANNDGNICFPITEKETLYFTY